MLRTLTLKGENLIVRWFLIASLLLLILVVSIDMINYPAIITTAGGAAVVYLAMFVVAVLSYGGLGFLSTRATSLSERVALQQGTLWGLVCGGAWIIELLVANVIGPQLGAFNLILYFGSAITGYLLPGLAGLLAARRAGQFGAGLRAGLLCGMVGGIMIFLASIVFSALLFSAGQADPQTLREFQRSGLSDFKTYIVGDYLAGMIAHLWIGLISGLGLGAIGGAIGRALARPAQELRTES